METAAPLDGTGLGRSVCLPRIARPLCADAAPDLGDGAAALDRAWRVHIAEVPPDRLVGTGRGLLCGAARGRRLETLATRHAGPISSTGADDSCAIRSERRLHCV